MCERPKQTYGLKRVKKTSRAKNAIKPRTRLNFPVASRFKTTIFDENDSIAEDYWKDSFDKLLDGKTPLRKQKVIKKDICASFNRNSSLEGSFNWGLTQYRGPIKRPDFAAFCTKKKDKKTSSFVSTPKNLIKKDELNFPCSPIDEPRRVFPNGVNFYDSCGHSKDDFEFFSEVALEGNSKTHSAGPSAKRLEILNQRNSDNILTKDLSKSPVKLSSQCAIDMVSTETRKMANSENNPTEQRIGRNMKTRKGKQKTSNPADKIERRQNKHKLKKLVVKVNRLADGSFSTLNKIQLSEIPKLVIENVDAVPKRLIFGESGQISETDVNLNNQSSHVSSISWNSFEIEDIESSAEPPSVTTAGKKVTQKFRKKKQLAAISGNARRTRRHNLKNRKSLNILFSTRKVKPTCEVIETETAYLHPASDVNSEPLDLDPALDVSFANIPSKEIENLNQDRKVLLVRLKRIKVDNFNEPIILEKNGGMVDPAESLSNVSETAADESTQNNENISEPSSDSVVQRKMRTRKSRNQIVKKFRKNVKATLKTPILTRHRNRKNQKSLSFDKAAEKPSPEIEAVILEDSLISSDTENRTSGKDLILSSEAAFQQSIENIVSSLDTKKCTVRLKKLNLDDEISVANPPIYIETRKSNRLSEKNANSDLVEIISEKSSHESNVIENRNRKNVHGKAEDRISFVTMRKTKSQRSKVSENFDSQNTTSTDNLMPMLIENLKLGVVENTTSESIENVKRRNRKSKNLESRKSKHYENKRPELVANEKLQTNPVDQDDANNLEIGNVISSNEIELRQTYGDTKVNTNPPGDGQSRSSLVTRRTTRPSKRKTLVEETVNNNPDDQRFSFVTTRKSQNSKQISGRITKDLLPEKENPFEEISLQKISSSQSESQSTNENNQSNESFVDNQKTPLSDTTNRTLRLNKSKDSVRIRHSSPIISLSCDTDSSQLIDNSRLNTMEIVNEGFSAETLSLLGQNQSESTTKEQTSLNISSMVQTNQISDENPNCSVISLTIDGDLFRKTIQEKAKPSILRDSRKHSRKSKHSKSMCSKLKSIRCHSSSNSNLSSNKDTTADSESLNLVLSTLSTSIANLSISNQNLEQDQNYNAKNKSSHQLISQTRPEIISEDLEQTNVSNSSTVNDTKLLSNSIRLPGGKWRKNLSIWRRSNMTALEEPTICKTLETLPENEIFLGGKSFNASAKPKDVDTTIKDSSIKRVNFSNSKGNQSTREQQNQMSRSILNRSQNNLSRASGIRRISTALLLEPTDDEAPNLSTISLLDNSALGRNLYSSFRSVSLPYQQQKTTDRRGNNSETNKKSNTTKIVKFNESSTNERRHTYQQQLSIPVYRQPSLPRRRRTSVLECNQGFNIAAIHGGGDSFFPAEFGITSVHEASLFLRSQQLDTRAAVLRRCGQSEPLDFATIYSQSVLRQCRKIGEGVYGEVFMNKTVHGEPIVLKIIPIEGTTEVNGETQKKFDEILSEIVIAMELSHLRNDKFFMTSNFVEVKKVRCVQGRYPEHLTDLWELYRDNCGTENDHPEIFPDDQLYIVLELANGGQDLEAFTFENALQSYSAFLQTILTLAVAEQKFQFEHRDLHWGNILLAPTNETKLNFKIGGKEITIATHGVKATIIDYTLSRMVFNGCHFYNDLSNDDELFTATGDYQYDIYRFMKERLDNDWERFEPYTNILWLHYTVDKMINGARYRHSKSKKHRGTIQDMMEIRDDLLDYKSASDYVDTNLR